MEKKNVPMKMLAANGQNHHISQAPKSQGLTRTAAQIQTKHAHARIVSRKITEGYTHSVLVDYAQHKRQASEMRSIGFERIINSSNSQVVHPKL